MPIQNEAAGSVGRGEWPSAGLDVQELESAGWRPVPFQEFIIKIYGGCNLACDYCYIYESADQSWRSRPAVMSEATIRRAAERIGRHARQHVLGAVDVVLHGGEPLMAGRDLIEFAAGTLREAMPPGCEVDISLQTNGTLLTRRMLDILACHDIGVAVSMDGDRDAHDRHRRYANGRGSHNAMRRGLDLLAGGYRALYCGLLCTIDLANDPVRTYESMLESGPPRIDFLLPHGTWSAPPPGVAVPADGRTPYADWLIAVFDRWYRAPRKETGIRCFEEIINVILGGQSTSENYGLSPVAMIVIDTDGSLQQVDTLKTSFAGAPETGLTVFGHDFDAALRHPGVVARQIGLAALCETCRGCAVREICGGGAYTHRYQAGHGYLNPSVYCADLTKLITHIAGQLHRDLAATPSRDGVTSPCASPALT